MRPHGFQGYLLPDFVFQSVIIASGCGIEGELAEFFMMYGALGGLPGMLLAATATWNIVNSASFEFAPGSQRSS